MLDLSKLSEAELNEILATSQTKGYKFFMKALEEEISGQLNRMKLHIGEEVAEVNYWRGLQNAYDLLGSVGHLAGKMNSQRESERIEAFTETNWAELVASTPSAENVSPEQNPFFLRNPPAPHFMQNFESVKL